MPKSLSSCIGIAQHSAHWIQIFSPSNMIICLILFMIRTLSHNEVVYFHLLALFHLNNFFTMLGTHVLVSPAGVALKLCHGQCLEASDARASTFRSSSKQHWSAGGQVFVKKIQGRRKSLVHSQITLRGSMRSQRLQVPWYVHRDHSDHAEGECECGAHWKVGH